MSPTKTIGIEITAKDKTAKELKKAGDNLAKLVKSIARTKGFLEKPSREYAKGMGAALAKLGVTAGTTSAALLTLGAAALPLVATGLAKLAGWAATLAANLGRTLVAAVGKTVQVLASLVAEILKLTMALVKLAAQGLAMAVRGVLQLGASLTKLAAIASGVALAGVVALTGAFLAAVIPAVNYARDLALVDRAFRTIAGESAPAMLDALRKGSAFMLDDITLMKSYNDIVLLVSKQVGERLPEALSYLRKISAATGTDMEYMYNSLARGVGRLAPRIIDNLKVIVSLEEATARAADMFGIAEDAVSKAQKQLGMFEVVMERLAARTKDLPDVLGTVAQKLGMLSAMAKNAQGVIGTIFLPAANSLLGIAVSLAKGFGRLIAEGGALNNIFMHVSASVTVLGESFANLVSDAMPSIESGLNSMADRLISFAWSAIQYGANITTNLAIGLVRGGAGALMAAINWISNILTYWLGAHSAPRILPDLYQWGAAVFTEYLRGFSAADFSALEAVQGPLMSAMKLMVNLGELGEEAVGARFVHASEEMARAMDEFNRTGQYSESVLTELTAAGGQFGDVLASLFEKQMALAGGVNAVTAAELRLQRARDAEERAGEGLVNMARAYNKALRKGASAQEMALRYARVRTGYNTLVNARDETEEAETQLDISKEQLKILQEMARAQEGLIRQLIAMQEARLLPGLPAPDAGPADGGGGGADLIPEGEEFTLPGMPDLTPFEQSFEDLKNSIAEKFRALWDKIIDDWEKSGVGQLIKRLKETWENSKLKLWWDNFWAHVSAVGFIQAVKDMWVEAQVAIENYLKSDDKLLWISNIWAGLFGEDGFDGALIWSGILLGLETLWTDHMEPGIRNWLMNNNPVLGAIWSGFMAGGFDHGMANMAAILENKVFLPLWVKFATGVAKYLLKRAPALGIIWRAFVQEGILDGTGKINWKAGLDLLWKRFFAALNRKAFVWGQNFGDFLMWTLWDGLRDAINNERASSGVLTALAFWVVRLAKASVQFWISFGKGIWDSIQGGFLGRMQENWETFETAWTLFWQKVVDKTKEILGIHSDSSVFQEIGQSIADGFTTGISGIGDSITTLLNEGILDLTNTFKEGSPLGQSINSLIRRMGEGGLGATLINLRTWAGDLIRELERIGDVDVTADVRVDGGGGGGGGGGGFGGDDPVDPGDGDDGGADLGPHLPDPEDDEPTHGGVDEEFHRGGFVPRGLSRALLRGPEVVLPLNSPATISVLRDALVGALDLSGSQGSQGSPIIIHNHFGKDSIRSDRDIMKLVDQQRRALTLRGVRGSVT